MQPNDSILLMHYDFSWAVVVVYWLAESVLDRETLEIHSCSLKTFFHYLFPTSNLISADHLCRGVIRTHVELHQNGNSEGRSTD